MCDIELYRRGAEELDRTSEKLHECVKLMEVKFCSQKVYCIPPHCFYSPLDSFLTGTWNLRSVCSLVSVDDFRLGRGIFKACSL